MNNSTIKVNGIDQLLATLKKIAGAKQFVMADLGPINNLLCRSEDTVDVAKAALLETADK